MKIAFVAARPPFPLDSGGRIRTFHLLREVSRVHAVTLLTATEGAHGESSLAALCDAMPGLAVRAVRVPSRKTRRSQLRRAMQSAIDPLPYTWTAYRDARFRAKLAATLAAEPFDLVHCDHIQVAHALTGLPTPPSVLNAHNVESVLARRVGETQASWLKRRLIAWQCAKTVRAERDAHRHFARSVVVSDVDRTELERMVPGVEVSVVPNGVDLEVFRSDHADAEPYTMAFVGAMDWAPNIDAVHFFVDQVFPRIRAVIPGARFLAVGRNPSPSLSRCCAVDGVHLTGSVDDVRPYVARAQLVVVPLRSGGGTRLKILEAWAMRKPVLSTSVGAEGLPAIAGESIELADTPEALSARAIALLRAPQRAARLGAAGRRIVEEQFSWPCVAGRLLDAYEATLASAMAPRGSR